MNRGLFGAINEFFKVLSPKWRVQMDPKPWPPPNTIGGIKHTCT